LNAAELKTAALAGKENLIALRRDFHRHPELSGQEEKTAARVATELESLGLAVETGIAGFGVVAVLEGGQPGRTALLRADMDALPVTERSGVEFASPQAVGARYPVLEIPTPLLAGEDFAYFARAVPGAMFLLGVGNPDMEAAYPLHHPQFRIDEEALPVGVATMACAIASFCAGNDGL
jgi:amidohydrolase